jgi:hypothetical protein
MKFSAQNLLAGIPATVNVEGLRLSQITELWIGVEKLNLTIDSSGRITMQLPALAAGMHNLRVIYAAGSVLVHQDAFEVSNPTPAPVSTLRFTSFAGDSFRLTAASRAAISEAINARTGITKVICVGSTSGTRPTPGDRRLALRRAQEACNHAQQLIRDAQIELRANPAAGIGPRFRSVSIQILTD